MLKADLHIHTFEDPCHRILYTAKAMIKYKAKLGFKVLAVTNHNSIYFNNELDDYAKKLGVILFPGMEALIGGKEVLIINADQRKLKYWKSGPEFRRVYKSIYPSLGVLENFRNEGMVIGAPHPFYPGSNCLGEELIKNIRNFDFVEHCHFYTAYFNKNKQAAIIARKFNKTLIANTDAHNWFQLGLKNYSYINSNFNKEDVLEAIRANKVHITTEPLNLRLFIYIAWLNVFDLFDKRLLSCMGVTSKYKNI